MNILSKLLLWFSHKEPQYVVLKSKRGPEITVSQEDYEQLKAKYPGVYVVVKRIPS